MRALEELKRDVFVTLFDISGKESDRKIFLNGYLIPSKGIYEVWFPYSIEAAKILKPGIFLAVKNFSSIELYDEGSQEKKEEEHYTILEIIETEIVHYKIRELSENPQELKVEESFKKFMEDWYRHASQPEKESLKIIVKAVQHSEELVIRSPMEAANQGKEEISFEELTEAPISGERVFIIKEEYLDRFINGKIKELPLSFPAGKHKIFKNIDVFINQEALFNRHFAIFGFTGAGKSNLMSTLIYKSLLETKENPTNIFIFDVNNEYLGLLFDVLLQVDGAIIFLNPPGGSLELFFKGITTKEVLLSAAKELVDKTTFPKAISKEELKEKLYLISLILLLSRKVRILAAGSLTFEVMNILKEIFEKAQFSGQGAKEKNKILQDIFSSIYESLKRKGLLGVNFNPYIRDLIIGYLRYFSSLSHVSKPQKTANKVIYRVIKALKVKEGLSDKIQGKIFEIISEFKKISDEIIKKTEYYNSITPQELLVKTHDDESSLFIVQSENDNTIREFAHYIGMALYQSRRNGVFQNNPQTVFILEEADLFIPTTPTGSKEEKASIEKSKQIATMLARRGRKYNLGLGIATQRVTYLDTSITAQLATYFISKLPKRTDRERAAEAFGVESQVLKQTLSFGPGEWMVLTHVDALHRKAVPVPIKFENANERLLRFLYELEIKEPPLEDELPKRKEEEVFLPLPDSEDLTPIFVEV